ncbi:MAG: tyrosine--tRNA ligase [Saprospiraceae bacterium]|nr:tyrosine--tRNA ligase [Saprospiraceae bacterium]MDP4700147.1 tyrosine--tRNA ligase [Saprospiraceae bacterium]MDP4812870.1 tyrosine--tRNA ligase [Saprospiraceae bacterium]MDP4914824.1 tyrosine--tRNA ligase [Saprospiraceae bacterium]MDP5048949.1 tyrosine--tRNA ligase [Saprospiraceae bacterium]
MDFLSELRWRGMLQDVTPGLEDYLKTEKVTAYIGFDPTAPSLTIGNYVQIMLLTLLQKYGHKPIVLLGGATGRIGDPSGKDKERQLKSYEELDSNLNFQKEQFKKLIDFNDAENPAMFINNLDFYKDLNILEFLRVAGKTLTVNYMLSKDSVQNRLENGLSFTEFSYQLLQAYDFQCLYNDYGCKLQMGGSDQWGNITSGTEFIRRNIGGKAYALTTPLLTKADGTKFGKSAEGNIWLDSKLTSPYRFYQFWINAADADIPTFVRYFTFFDQDTILKREKDLDIREQKLLLAEELTVRIHGKDAYQAVLKVTDLLFNKPSDDQIDLSETELEMIANEIPTFDISSDSINNNLTINDLLTTESQILSSKGEVRRAIQNNALKLNKEKITSGEDLISLHQLIRDKYIILENGKKNKYLFRFN